MEAGGVPLHRGTRGQARRQAQHQLVDRPGGEGHVVGVVRGAQVGRSVRGLPVLVDHAVAETDHLVGDSVQVGGAVPGSPGEEVHQGEARAALHVEVDHVRLLSGRDRAARARRVDAHVEVGAGVAAPAGCISPASCEAEGDAEGGDRACVLSDHDYLLGSGLVEARLLHQPSRYWFNGLAG